MMSQSNRVAQTKASLKSLQITCSGTLAAIIMAQPQLPMVANLTSTRLFCCGVSCAVYSKFIPNFHTALSY
eukprot:5039441-Ditylum_brightwellii.AAC.1